MESRRRARQGRRTVLALLLTSLAVPPAAAASPVLLEWSTTASFVISNPIPQVPDGVAVGDTVSGSFRYDSEATPYFTWDFGANYSFTGGWTLNIDGHDYTGEGFEIHILDNHPTFGDEFFFFASDGSTNDPDFSYSYLVGLRNFQADSWNSAALPTTIDQQQFELLDMSVTRMNATYINLFGQQESGINLGGIVVKNRLTDFDSFEVRPIPEPATLLLVGAGVPLAAAARRRRRKQ